MKWQPMQKTVWWGLLHPDGRWWCDKPILTRDLARRTAKAWNNTKPKRLRRDARGHWRRWPNRVRVVRLQFKVTR